MAKTITLRLDEKVYEKFKNYAETDNRTLANFIETAALRYIYEIEEADEFEMREIRANKYLSNSLKRGIRDARLKKGKFIE